MCKCHTIQDYVRPGANYKGMRETEWEKGFVTLFALSEADLMSKMMKSIWWTWINCNNNIPLLLLLDYYQSAKMCVWMRANIIIYRPHSLTISSESLKLSKIKFQHGINTLFHHFSTLFSSSRLSMSRRRRLIFSDTFTPLHNTHS